MLPDPTFSSFETRRRIADAQSIAAAERLVHGSARHQGQGALAAMSGAVRRLFAASTPRTAAEPR
jgi:hypothetical protein